MEGSGFTEVKGGQGFHRSDLNSEHLFIVHAGGKIYVWIGDKVDGETKKKAFEVGSNFLEKKGLASNLQIQALSPLFHPSVILFPSRQRENGVAYVQRQFPAMGCRSAQRTSHSSQN